MTVNSEENTYCQISKFFVGLSSFIREGATADGAENS